jgi:hypothetical protein
LRCTKLLWRGQKSTTNEREPNRNRGRKAFSVLVVESKEIFETLSIHP